jgi:hypothetical protein
MGFYDYGSYIVFYTEELWKKNYYYGRGIFLAPLPGSLLSQRCGVMESILNCSITAYILSFKLSNSFLM